MKESLKVRCIYENVSGVLVLTETEVRFNEQALFSPPKIVSMQTNQQTSARPMLRIVTSPEKPHTFIFPSKDIRDLFKSEVMKLIHFSPASSSSNPNDPNAHILASNPFLSEIYRCSVANGSLTPEEFWNIREGTVLVHENLRAQRRGFGEVWNEDQTYFFTPSATTAIFLLYPPIKKAHSENVPLNMTEAEFWSQYIRSSFLSTEKNHKTIIDRYMEQNVNEEEKPIDIPRQINQCSVFLLSKYAPLPVLEPQPLKEQEELARQVFSPSAQKNTIRVHRWIPGIIRTFSANCIGSMDEYMTIHSFESGSLGPCGDTEGRSGLLDVRDFFIYTTELLRQIWRSEHKERFLGVLASQKERLLALEKEPPRGDLLGDLKEAMSLVFKNNSGIRR